MVAYDHIAQTKLCSDCRERKPVSEFAKRKNHGRDPYQPRCLICSRKSYRDWATKNRDKKLAYLRARRLAKLEEARAYDANRWKRPEIRARRREVVRANKAGIIPLTTVRAEPIFGALGDTNAPPVKSQQRSTLLGSRVL